jgi:molybdopterin-guanine dinucleotide biosynthesis protein A
LLQADAAQAPLRGCLLSGGASRRMGTDKAQLPHPEGGSWLERTLSLLLELDIPVTLLSRHPRHLQLARAMASRHTLQPGLAPMVGADSAAAGFFPTAPRPEQAQAMPFPGSAPRLIAVSEPPPWQGPLLALHRLMQGHPDERLLLCPVDMPWLTPETLQTLLRAAADQPQRIHLAHDGERLQPLLGVYPSQVAQRDALRAAIEAGERRLQGWLASQCCREVRLDRLSLRNVNQPEQLGDDPGWGPAA